MAKRAYSKKELDAQFAEATRLGAEAAADEPHAESASYDPRSKRIVINLDPDRSFAFSAKLIDGLAEASPDSIANINVTPDGSGLRWNDLDIDLGVAELLAGIYGTRKWMAKLGRRGGQVRSPAKAAAAMENGKKGGRPPRSVIPDNG